MNIVTINDVDLPVLEHQGQRVVTLSQVDAVHGRASGTAGRNFREHKARFQEGEDYFVVSSDEIRRNSPKAIPDMARRSDVILLTEAGYTMLVKPFNDDLAWQVQRQVVTGYFAAQRLIASAPPQLTGYVADGCTLIEFAGRTLRLAPSAILGMFQKLADKTGHAGLLPDYAVDAPANEGGSSATTFSLTELLHRHGIELDARKVNPLLEKAGLLEHKTRPSSKKGQKQFWSLTTAGLAYGKNLTNSSNQRETQPHFYESEFPKLLEVIGLNGLLEAA